MALSFDRQAFVDIVTEGQGDIGGVMQPPPEGLWGMPLEILKTLPGYDPDVKKNRTEARRIMEKLGYGPEKRLKVKVSVRDLPFFRDPAVIMIDQLKAVYIDGELEMIDTTNWLPKVMRKDYTIGFSPVAGGPDPDQNLYLNYGCGGALNYTGYCNPAVDDLIDRQSIEADQEKRKKLVWEIERKLAEDGARPILFYDRRADLLAALCEGPDDHGQQHLQRCTHGRRVARQIASTAVAPDRRVNRRWQLRVHSIYANLRSLSLCTRAQ
jgi:peptide/nickel transport system substrate-binding protein